MVRTSRHNQGNILPHRTRTRRETTILTTMSRWNNITWTRKDWSRQNVKSRGYRVIDIRMGCTIHFWTQEMRRVTVLHRLSTTQHGYCTRLVLNTTYGRIYGIVGKNYFEGRRPLRHDMAVCSEYRTLASDLSRFCSTVRRNILIYCKHINSGRESSIVVAEKWKPTTPLLGGPAEV